MTPPDRRCVQNRPPTAQISWAGGEEGTVTAFDASASSDPDGDRLTYRWDFESDGVWDTAYSPGPAATHVWGDDYEGLVTAEVSDGTYTATATAAVVIGNVAPTLDDLEVYATADLVLRVAGEKFHDVCLTLATAGRPETRACVIRTPGSPDRWTATLFGGRLHLLRDTAIILTYTPDNDPVNGQRNGATPAWVDLTFADGSVTRLQHTFNVRHPDTWTWTVDDLSPLLVGRPLTFEVSASDPGSDDLIVEFDFGDGGSFTATVFNDGLGPDLYPTPSVNPIIAVFSATHAYAAGRAFTFTAMVEDDDGGSSSDRLTIAL